MADLKPVIVIGLGNPLMADEGIGVELVNRLAKLAAAGTLPSETVEYYDGGCGGMSLLHIIAGRRKVILIDCAKMGLKPGTIKRFTPDDVNSIKKLTHLSLHEIDIIKVLELARMLGQSPEEIVIFGIEPASIEQQMNLTAELQDRVDEFLKAIQKELKNPA
ncbi:MAG: HyaD/HybD family hydrogenase maturation endopeptidase [Planctomycetaceae bacterium]|nr:HyaD/HybD family hydrogenase maturation endopeptidase [Planctomycetaceae bacterium]